MKIVYYVSGHGYGHATRVCEVVRWLLDGGCDVTVVSAAPEFIFHEIMVLGAQYRKSDIDAGGVVQQGPLEVSVNLTTAQVQRFMQSQRESVITTEREWLWTHQPNLVATDAAFAPLVASRSLSIPAVVVSNFTWDGIYSDYMLPEITDAIKSDYALANYFLRLPGHIATPAFDERQNDVLDIPLVVRKPRQRREVTRSQLHIAPEDKVVLIQFGGHESSKPWGEVKLPSGWVGIVISENPSSLPAYLRGVSKESYLPDLVDASDAVLGKLGYGTCSETISLHKPLIYVNRTNFNEQVGLLNMMLSHGCAVEMGVEDFHLGNWADAILKAEKEASQRDFRSSVLGTHGGKYAADMLLRIAHETKARTQP